MEIRKSYFLGSAIISLGLLFTGCSDDESSEPGIPSSSTSDVTDDVTLGYNSIIIDLDNPTSIPLNNDAEVSLMSDNPNVDFFVEKLGDRQVITPVLKQPIETIDKPFTTKVNVKVNNSKSLLADKEIYVSFRRNLTSDVKTPDVNYARAIGKGTKPWKGMGNVTFPILSFDAIYPNLAINENITSKSIFFETSGERYVSSLENIAANVGLSGTIPIEGVLLSGSAAYGYNNTNATSNAFEYYMGYYGKSMSEVKLNTDWALDKVKNADLIALLDSTANNVLNNPSSAAYKNYPNTKDGIYKLLDQYGTHVITKAVFGGNYTVLYSREENAYETSVGHDASASISATTTLSTDSKNWSQVYVDKTNSPAIDVSASGSNYTEDYNTASKGFHLITAKGGNASEDMNSWDESVNAESRDSWVPISYKTNDSDKTNGLIPITEFIVDSIRCNAVNLYLNDYYNEHCVTINDSPMVIVDFMMKTGSDNHKDGEPAPFVAKDPSGIYRIYYPMMANEKAPTDNGYAIETSQRKYIVADDNVDHYWYYALGHLDDNKTFGITDIIFDNKNHDGYTRRGNHTNDGIPGCLDNNYVYLKYASKDTNQKDLITGIALRDDSGNIIASTGGTEMAYPWGSDNSRFNKYWANGAYITPSNPSSEWWFVGGLIKNCNFKPVYTTQPLDVNFSFGNGNSIGQICHPKKWGE